eukprot:2877163-Ditylum_brightwellii.AAC.1
MWEEHVIVGNDIVQLTLVMSLVLVPLSEYLKLIGWSSSKFNTPLQVTCSGEFVEKAMSSSIWRNNGHSHLLCAVS